MANLKETTINGSLSATGDASVKGTLTAASIKRSDNSSNILKGDGGTLTYGNGSGFNISTGHDHPYLSSSTKYAGVASGESAGGKAARAAVADKANGVIDYNNDTVWGVDYDGNSGTTPRTWWCGFDDKNKKIVPVKAPSTESCIKFVDSSKPQGQGSIISAPYPAVRSYYMPYDGLLVGRSPGYKINYMLPNSDHSDHTNLGSFESFHMYLKEGQEIQIRSADGSKRNVYISALPLLKQG